MPASTARSVAFSSVGYGTDGTQHVGIAYLGIPPGGQYHAGLWAGTAASWVDLSTALTGSWGDTEAESVWVSGGAIYVAGWGRNLTTNRDEALLWTGQIPAGCDPDFNRDGNVDQDDVAAVINVVAGGTCP